MAVREFRDANGHMWRAWNITPDSIHPATKAEDYLVGCYELGWIVFERADGREKKRLCPYPDGWDGWPDAELLKLMASAEGVSARKLASERRFEGEQAPATIAASGASGAVDGSEEPPDVTDLKVVRSFRYPGGRLWTVCVIARPENGGPPVLRFSAGSRVLDLKTWPHDWADYTDARLVEMLRAATPRTTHTPTPGMPHRRYVDSGPETTP